MNNSIKEHLESRAIAIFPGNLDLAIEYYHLNPIEYQEEQWLRRRQAKVIAEANVDIEEQYKKDGNLDKLKVGGIGLYLKSELVEVLRRREAERKQPQPVTG